MQALDSLPIQLIPATQVHLLEIMPWFPTAYSCRIWGGPEFRFPFTLETFLADSKLATIASYALIEGAAEVAAFGQFYSRVGRCHLCRLAVAPDRRGRGLGAQLIEALLREGKKALDATEGSLFVHGNNATAITLYKRLGFVFSTYPEPGFHIPDSHYMVSPCG